MKDTKSINVVALDRVARISEDKESYMLLEREHGYRVGVGAEIAPSSQPSFFFELPTSALPRANKC